MKTFVYWKCKNHFYSDPRDEFSLIIKFFWFCVNICLRKECVGCDGCDGWGDKWPLI